MTPTEATAEIFLTAFLNLPHAEQDTFFTKLFRNKRLREDVIDLAIAEERSYEKTKSFTKVVADIIKSR